MTELINSLKTFAYSSSGERRNSAGRIIPGLLNNLGVGKQEDPGFTQWRDAMRMVARLPGGLPTEFRLKLWENLSEKYLSEKGIPWSRIVSKSATPTDSARDAEIGDQIHKDLHRTGCSGFSGAKQVKLKSVLVSYARWNPSVGYCQGFNMIGAMLLEMTQGDEILSLKVLIFLIEGVLPQGYFSGGLRGLAVDMAVFREVLRIRKPTLHSQLCRLQGGEEQPPLIDVFTMHWFLTLFIHCLPTPSVLRIWDLVFLEGSEVLLRAALVLWAAVEPRILEVKSADEFYSVMGIVTREMLECGLMDPNSLVKCIVSVGPFPFPGLDELRQKHRSLLQKDTPYKSFFLAKRELDNLKKHYAAIKHRQKATTIILKGLEVSRKKNNLFIPTKIISTTKPKSNNKTVTLTKEGVSTSAIKTPRVGVGVGVGAVNHNHNHSGKKVVSNSTSSSFRRRRTRSSESSSDTELCDSSEDGDGGSSSEGVWSDSDNKWIKNKKGEDIKKTKAKTAKVNGHCKEDGTKVEVEDKVEEDKVSVGVEIIVEDGKKKKKDFEVPEKLHESKRFEFKWDFDSPVGDKSIMDDIMNDDDIGDIDKDIGVGDNVKISRSPSFIDTNDSQHFLEEMTKLGKSDSFYENLSRRICQLQFENLKTLRSCQTVIDPKSLSLPPFPKSPLPSPISPIPPSLSSRLGYYSTDSGHQSPTPEESERPRAGSVSPSDLGLVYPSSESVSNPVTDSTPGLEFPESASISGDKTLLSPLLTTPSSPQNKDKDKSEDDHHLVFPRSPESPKKNKLSLRSLSGSNKSSIEEDDSTLIKPTFLFEEAKDLKDEMEEQSPNFPTALCLGQFNSDIPSEEEIKINAVIRENIAILQRLKLSKPTFMDDEEYESYEDEDEEEEQEVMSERESRTGSIGSEDRDSGIPSSSKSARKERLSSVSSNSSNSSSRRRSSSTGSNCICGRRRSIPSPSTIKPNVNSHSHNGNDNNNAINAKKGFNPFPTVRKARLRITKYGLYN